MGIPALLFTWEICRAIELLLRAPFEQLVREGVVETFLKDTRTEEELLQYALAWLRESRKATRAY